MEARDKTNRHSEFTKRIGLQGNPESADNSRDSKKVLVRGGTQEHQKWQEDICPCLATYHACVPVVAIVEYKYRLSQEKVKE